MGSFSRALHWKMMRRCLLTCFLIFRVLLSRRSGAGDFLSQEDRIARLEVALGRCTSDFLSQEDRIARLEGALLATIDAAEAADVSAGLAARRAAEATLGM